MKIYVVVYLVCGMHYRYRCSAKNAREARRAAIECMGISNKDITEVYREQEWR